MQSRVLMTGNEALAEGAIRSGCDAYFGYPITPQNEITSYMAKHMVDKGRVFIQAESELAAINMVFGAAVAGKRAMTSSSSPGISLKQEGISYIAAAELPAVIVNVQRGGPGLGNISPGQADYFQAVKGGGHGDYHQVVLAPDSVQEMHDFPALAFELADKYRTPVMILSDGRLGQMMEPVKLHDGPPPPVPAKPWALDGCKGRKPNFIRSLFLNDDELEERNFTLQKKYTVIRKDEVRFKELNTKDCDILVVAYGTCARVVRGAMSEPLKDGLKVGLLRPITLWPFPYDAIRQIASRVKGVLVVEMSAGQMIEDVRLAVEGAAPVSFVGRMAGKVPPEREIAAEIRRISGIKRGTGGK